MNEATKALLEVKKKYPEACDKELQILVGKRYNEIRVKRMIELGWSFEDIAKETKLSESIVRKIAEKV